LIVDAQVHIWDPPSDNRRWPAGGEVRAREHIRNPFSASQLLKEMDAAGVDRAILVPPSFEGDRNDVVLAAASDFPSRFAAMGRVPIDRPGVALRIMSDWADHVGAIGFRFTFSAGFFASRGVSGAWLTDGTCDWAWRTAEERSLPVMLHCPGHLDVIRDIARRFPRLRITVDHFGASPGAVDADVVRSVREACALAGLENVSVKASAGPCYTRESYPFRLMQTCVKMLYDSFGPMRVFWGSDLSRLRCSYKEALAYVAEGCEFLPSAGRRMVLGDGIRQWLAWP